MPKEPAASKITDAPKVTDEELEQAKSSDAPKPSESDMRKAREDAKQAPGTVLAEDDEYENVIVRRKKTGRPTGKYVAVANYRFSVTDQKVADAMKKQGAPVTRHRFEEGHDPEEKVPFIVTLSPGPKAYDLPEDVTEHALAAGAITPELR